MVIRALVRARLLGMRLLTIEARVVVGTENGRRPVISPLIPPSYDRNDWGLQSPRTEVVSRGSGTGFARAIELLAQGTETLDRIRRPAETKLPGLPGWMAANSYDVIHLRRAVGALMLADPKQILQTPRREPPSRSAVVRDLAF
jgi:hypothetical protein